MRLYHAPGSRSTRVLWLLEEIGAPPDVTLMPGTRAERDTPEHRRRHPLGRVPVVEDDEGYLFESAALCLHLADSHPDSGLIPPVGSRDRALVYQWTFFAMTELEPALIEIHRGIETGPQRFRDAANVLEHALDDREFLVGDSLSVADVVCGGILTSAKGLGVIDADFLDGLPNLVAYIERLDARPAKQRAWELGVT